MKLKYKDLPNFFLTRNGEWIIYNYSRVLVPTPESREEELTLEE